uniref:Endonuclease/exonuclease/phosphatase domain-containing protein n=1 Tax=Erpetoichthys calabaricus TaxID=27687 RepID=A0A8C4XEB8_ERPCA
MTLKIQNQCLHDGTVNFVSWNVKVCSQLTDLNAKVVFLQETHLLSKDQFRLQKDWTDQMFHSSFTKKTRGVGILIHRTIPLVASDVVSDPEGRYVMVIGNLFNCKMILINVYAPNVDDKEFIQLQFVTDHNLSDPWRFLNPNSRTYSFYSPVHHSYSKINNFFIDNNFLPMIKSCKNDTIVISDHAPLTSLLRTRRES